MKNRYKILSVIICLILMSTSYIIGYEKGLDQGTLNGRWIQLRAIYKLQTGNNLEDKIDREMPEAFLRALKEAK